MGRVENIRSRFESDPPRREVEKESKKLPSGLKIGLILDSSMSTKDIHATVIDLSADETAKAIDEVYKMIGSAIKEAKVPKELERLTGILNELNTHKEYLTSKPVKSISPVVYLLRSSKDPLSIAKQKRFLKLHTTLLKEGSEVAVKKIELERILERLEETKDPKEVQALNERFSATLEEYQERFAESELNANAINLRRMDGNELKTPEEFRYEMMHLSLGLSVPKDLEETPKLLKETLRGGVGQFVKMSKTRPQEAQFHLKKMSLIAAAVLDNKEFKEFAEAVSDLAGKVDSLPSSTEQLASKEGLMLYECSQLFSGLSDKAFKTLGIDPKAKEFVLSDETLDTTEIQGRLNRLRGSINTVSRSQIEGALSKTTAYVEEAIEGVRRATVENVKAKIADPTKKSKKEESKWLHFSAKKASGYLKQIWNAETWTEKILRTSALVATGGATALIIGAGIGVNFIPGFGPLLSPVVVGFAASAPEIYVRLNEGIDRVFNPEEDSLEKQMQGRMKAVIIDELRDRRIIPNYRATSKYSLSKRDQRKADELVDGLRRDLNEHYSHSGRIKDVVKAYQRVTERLIVTTAESDDWIYAAHSEILADWLYPELESCIDKLGNWTQDGNLKPEAELREKFLRKVGLA